MSKPDTRTAIAEMIQEARRRLPFETSFVRDCEGRCEECPFKLLEFLELELATWEARLGGGEVPSLGDVHRLGRDCTEVHALLQALNLAREKPGAESPAQYEVSQRHSLTRIIVGGARRD